MNVTRFVKSHDRFVRSEPWSDALRDYHERQIDFVHRERTVHLQVTLGIALLTVLALGLTLLATSWATVALTVLLCALLVPYTARYWRLEKSVQTWHLLSLRKGGFGPEAVAAVDGVDEAEAPHAGPTPTPGRSASPLDPAPDWVAGAPLVASRGDGPSMGLGAGLEASAGPRFGPSDPNERDIPTLAVQVSPEDLQLRALQPPSDLLPPE